MLRFVILQECLFAYFSSTLDAVITAAKSRGQFDNGIVSLKGMTSIELVHQDVVHTDRFSGGDCFAQKCMLHLQLCTMTVCAAAIGWLGFGPEGVSPI
jgi:hypothetical protein